MYGDYLKCDAVQVSHHGWGSASWEFFELLNPKVLLWNNSEFGFQYADKYQGYGKTESSTKLFNMPCVKENYFCNTIKMQCIALPFDFSTKKNIACDNSLLVSAASDRTFMLRLKDGKLIMINGGWRKEMWDKYDHKKLLNSLFAEMQSFAGTNTVTIAAYILTDADYYNNQFLAHLKTDEFANKVTIENIIYNFQSGCDNQSLADAINGIAANRIIAKTGQEMNIDEAKIKVLYAPNEEIVSSLRDAVTVVKLQLNGESVIFTGNMTDSISEAILSSGENITCGIVQVANCGLNNGGVIDFYKKCNAKIKIWNTGEYAYRYFNPNEGYGKSVVSTAVYQMGNSDENYFCDRILPQIIHL